MQRKSIAPHGNYVEKKEIKYNGDVNKTQILKILTYPILDSYIKYLTINKSKINSENFTKIIKFIHSRLYLIESILIINGFENNDRKLDILNEILYKNPDEIYSSELIKHISLSNVLNNPDDTLFQQLVVSINSIK